MNAERGVILLAVLLTLTLLAAISALMLRIGEADVASLRAERALLTRQVLLQSALARLAQQLPAQADVTPTVPDLPDGRVDARVFAAEGLLNPNRTPAGILQAGLVALGLTAARAEAVARAMLSARKPANRRGFCRCPRCWWSRRACPRGARSPSWSPALSPFAATRPTSGVGATGCWRWRGARWSWR